MDLRAGKGIRERHGSSIDSYRVTVLVPLPPLPEQAAIVRYLDYVDRRIRRYIRAKQKLIALLNEQKQAIIQQAVTRGLDPNVRLKPSGVAWLGDVPEHWETCRSGTFLSRQRIRPRRQETRNSIRWHYTLGEQRKCQQSDDCLTTDRDTIWRCASVHL